MGEVVQIPIIDCPTEGETIWSLSVGKDKETLTALTNWSLVFKNMETSKVLPTVKVPAEGLIVKELAKVTLGKPLRNNKKPNITNNFLVFIRLILKAIDELILSSIIVYKTKL